ncbi:phosphatidyl inositol kinase [Borealophlyctis nickersoniae]|nr:phosphatidyl inositol kinase [Borealophlyctis nickersoniae]
MEDLEAGLSPSGSRSTRNHSSHIPSLAVNLEDEPALTGPMAYADSLMTLPADFTNPVPPVTPISDAQFVEIINEVRAAIAEGIHPTLIAQGSSGSYFCRNRAGEVVGVFKPKNEEPYGHLNPKWTKWIHRNLFPCCFGRSCIIPNLGYISEAAASYMDRRLQLNVVPRTEIVYLSSPTFYYPSKDRKAYRLGKPLPAKIGSFQTFLRGYKDATQFFKEGYERIRSGGMVGSDPLNPYGWSDQARKEFQWGFERLCVLDYLVRQTDRGLDNWMIKFDDEAERQKQESAGNIGGGEGGKPNAEVVQIGESQPPSMLGCLPDGPERSETSTTLVPGSTPPATQVAPAIATTMKATSVASVTPPSSPPLTAFDLAQAKGTVKSTVNPPEMIAIDSSAGASDHTVVNGAKSESEQSATESGPRPVVQIAAIDNGLAFPWKHPDRWRSYPYGWSVLPVARVPFCTETRLQILYFLSSSEWWRETLDGLERLFRIDADFSESMWRKQRAVVRGEGYNLVEVLRRSESGGLDGSPWALVRRPVVCVYEEEIIEEDDGLDGLDGIPEDGEYHNQHQSRHPPNRDGGGQAGGRPNLARRPSFVERSKRGLRRVRQRFETFTRSQPCFTTW